MTWDQSIVFGILALAMFFFIWGRYRYDVVAVLALLAAVFMGVVPGDDAFAGFGHPAVITVAAVLIISKALQISGMVDLMVGLLRPASRSTLLQVGMTSGLGLAFSAFMNNIGALALMLPVALRQAARAGRAPALILMPLSFGTLLGGLVTLIGTPPNIIIASFRQEVTGEPFAMFDFTPVGLPVALTGLAFITFIGWRLLPHDRKGKDSAGAEQRFAVESFLMESRVPDRSNLIGAQIRDLEVICENEMTVVALIRGGKSLLAPTAEDRIAARDILILEGDPRALAPLFGPGKLEHVVEESGFGSEELDGEDVALTEVMVMPGALVEGQSMRGLKMHQRFGINLLALARGDHKPRTRLGSIRFNRGDVLLLQGEREKLASVLPTIGCLPLAERDFPAAARQKRFPLALPIFLAAIVSAAFGLVTVPVAFVAAVAGLIVTNCMTLRDAYNSVEWPVIVLLGALLPIGEALQATGGTALVADAILAIAGGLPIWALLAVVVVVSMLLSDLVHNSPTAVLMAPIAVAIADSLALPPEPFLMAVALGAASPYLTPIGHQSNTLVMAPGGYHFGDYWRMGLPLDLVILAVGVPMIMWVWMP